MSTNSQTEQAILISSLSSQGCFCLPVICLTLQAFDQIQAPPASKEVVESLPAVPITAEHIVKGCSCPICQAEYKIGENVKQLPCDHMFHQSCILPWLSKTNSCPLCRHELPTDDPEYEEMKNLKVKEQDQQFRVETLHDSMFS
ncbi:E3 ubiquitin-protein ligase RNF181-like isoform X2 [Orbicella faveolata]|uniref:E3 ubiquitin-protein ligase RNF181-like isoform X2 n=1 Tax=Orbicella faveolata TaxID=48498 RepID=UPI0009E19DCF|nr:E3 ubiquitin-protein ligase RNF181-like isoform X2 [Orbicella faveolata]